MIPQDEWCFVGYAPKHLHDPGWLICDVVASVSGCISRGADFPDGDHEDETKWWDFNRARFYNSVDQAKAACKGEPPTIFAYWLNLYLFDAESGAQEAVNLDSLFPAAGSPFPSAPEDIGPILGYDVVGYDRLGEGEEWVLACSPLSCNGYANGDDGLTVNRLCLLPTEDTARRAQEMFEREQPEPGTYLIFRIHAGIH